MREKKLENPKHPIMISLSKDSSIVSPEKAPLDPNQKIRITYIQQSQLENFLRSSPHHVLALINYGRIQPPPEDATRVSISVNMEQLNDPPMTEVWTSPLPISINTVDGVHVAFNEEVVFGDVECEELNGIALDEVVYSAYCRMLDSLSSLGYPHLFRVWNYFPAINGEQKGLERYKRFCIGRHQAFFERHREYKSFLPAASAVGTRSGPFQLYFLAGRPKAFHIENPRQISAYDYPRMYGPQSPSFARATFTSMPSCSYLFIAGTASIVGHATQHKDDCFKQTKETLSNLESLMEQAKKANRELLRSRPSLSLLKVYVRHGQHIKMVKQTIQEYFDHQIPTLFLSGEMCRRNLLVEIEALYTIQPS
jgi:chorismate lyase/3-hydroxybenzoate synthase